MTDTFDWRARPAGPTFHVDGHSVRLLRDGVEAFPVMLEAIERACVEILLEMYWVGDDVVGRRYRDVLARRAREGIPVRVVVDAVGSLGLPARFWEPLERAGGIVHVYHTLFPLAPAFELRRVERRDHRKLLVVDGDLGVLGGINLALPWLPREHGGQGFRDDAVEVRGPAVSELRSLFYQTWRHMTGAKLPINVLPLRKARALRLWALASPSSRRVRRGIEREYLFRIQRARASIDLANAYFVPTGAFRHALYGAAHRGVRVRLLVPQRGDVAVVQMAQEALYRSFLDGGLEVYLLQGTVLHSKTAIIDEDFVTTGSYNFDERSRRNLELNVAVEDAAFARHVRDAFEVDLGSALRLDRDAWEGRGLARRGAEALAFMLRRLW